MQNADTKLAIIGDRGRRGLPLENVYRQLYCQDLYLRAYGRLYRNEGAMTEGVTDETVDGMSQRKIETIIELLRNERFRWTPVRRVQIPKGNGKRRPLGIPTWADKLLQEVMRSILEAYYEPQFSTTSHGFRPGRGCHTALKHIYCAWQGTKWFIEGDIKSCFDSIDHSILLSILREKIHDNRFLILTEDLLKAGYLEQWRYRPTLSGTPQGGIISPLLANIYMDRFDKFVEQTLVPRFNPKKGRKIDPEYDRLIRKIAGLRNKGVDWETLEPLMKELRTLSSKDQFDPDFRRLRYLRYADDFLLGFIGPKDEAEEIKVMLRDFLRDHLKLELSAGKTLITHAGTETARFLGYDIGVNWDRGIKRGRGHPKLRVPTQKLEDKVARYMRDGRPVARRELLHDSDFTIVELYGSEFRGFAQYYAFAENRFWLARLQWIMRKSLLKTLAKKHKSTAAAMYQRYQADVGHRGKRLRCIEVRVERLDKAPLIARFGGISLATDPFVIIEDRLADQDRFVSRNELITRLLADECELCGSHHDVQGHHVKKLADLNVKGRRERPDWMKIMASRRRKTLIVCGYCHAAIHAGRPTRKRQHGAPPTVEVAITGEPDA
jgi:group II intron reverse transcriptase/maturase